MEKTMSEDSLSPAHPEETCMLDQQDHVPRLQELSKRSLDKSSCTQQEDTTVEIDISGVEFQDTQLRNDQNSNAQVTLIVSEMGDENANDVDNGNCNFESVSDNILDNIAQLQQTYMFNTLNTPLPICTQTIVNNVDQHQYQGDQNDDSYVDLSQPLSSSTTVTNIPRIVPVVVDNQNYTLPLIEAPQPTFYQQPLIQEVPATSSSFRVIKSTPKIKQPHHTPHPRTGQVLFVNEEGASPQLFQNLIPGRVTPQSTQDTNQFITPNVTSMTRTNCSLNSSGEDTVNSPEEPLDCSNSATQDSYESNNNDLKMANLLMPSFDIPDYEPEETREQHNMKERRRRARIKDACDVMRRLVPGMSDKTDKATVFEFAARYIHFLKGFTGSTHDKDFLLKYSPY